jgi:hypothetical protein
MNYADLKKTPLSIQLALFFVGCLCILSISVSLQGRHIDIESTSHIGSYLCRKPFWAKVFDINANESGIFRARELSYFFDTLDAYLLRFNNLIGFYSFHSTIYLLSIAAICALQIFFSRAFFISGFYQNALLVLIFLSSPIVFLSSFFYRTSKILTSVFVFILCWLLTVSDKHEEGNLPSYFYPLFLLSAVFLPLLDEQGVFFLLCFTLVSGFLWYIKKNVLWRNTTFILLGSGLFYVFYRKLLGPELIYYIGGRTLDHDVQMAYTPGTAEILAYLHSIDKGYKLLRDWLVFYTGNSYSLSLIAAVFCLYLWWPHQRITLPENDKRFRFLGFFLLLFSLTALMVMNGLMLTRHLDLYTVPSAKLCYYGLPTMALILFMMGWTVNRFCLLFPKVKTLLSIFLMVVLARNLFMISKHRNTVIRAYQEIARENLETKYTAVRECIANKGTPLSPLSESQTRLCQTIASPERALCPP